MLKRLGWQGFGFDRHAPERTGLGNIWVLRLGFVSVRKRIRIIGGRMVDRMCLGKISEGKYSRWCSEECPCAAVCALIVIGEWLAEVNKWYIPEKGE